MSATNRWRQATIPDNSCAGGTPRAATVDAGASSPYYRAMENELRALEERVGQITALARRLRAENAELRQSLLVSQNEARALHAKVEGASTRLQSLLERLPEEAA